MLSQKVRYTIRALQELARRHDHGELTHLVDLATTQNIPAKYLTVILSELAREGLVHSVRGKNGGYRLALPPVDIRYGDIVRIMRGSIALVPCASRYAHEKCKNCLAEDECRLRSLMLMVRDRTAQVLDEITLADALPPPLDLWDEEPEAVS